MKPTPYLTMFAVKSVNGCIVLQNKWGVTCFVPRSSVITVKHNFVKHNISIYLCILRHNASTCFKWLKRGAPILL